jgi:hypothetical protein
MGYTNTNDDFGIVKQMDDIMNHFFPANSSNSFSFKGRFVNEEDYEIVPRKSKIEKDIKAKESDLAQTEARKKNDIQFYDSRIKSLKLEIDQLRQRLSP